MEKIQEIQINGTIRLGQFLKLTNMAQDGIEAKELIQNGYVTINGTKCTQRGLQLKNGDIVCTDIYNYQTCAKVKQI